MTKEKDRKYTEKDFHRGVTKLYGEYKGTYELSGASAEYFAELASYGPQHVIAQKSKSGSEKKGPGIKEETRRILTENPGIGAKEAWELLRDADEDQEARWAVWIDNNEKLCQTDRQNLTKKYKPITFKGWRNHTYYPLRDEINKK